VVVGPHPRLVTEVHFGTLLACLFPDLRELLLLPPLDCLRVLLVGAVQRPLRRQPEPVQQFPHPLRGHLDVELLTDEIPHDPAGPQREIERVWLFWSDRADGTAAIWAMVSLMRQAYSRVGCDRRVGAVMWKGSW
jgi:hypothetical protein